jgi:hypothetical protein
LSLVIDGQTTYKKETPYGTTKSCPKKPEGYHEKYSFLEVQELKCFAAVIFVLPIRANTCGVSPSDFI